MKWNKRLSRKLKSRRGYSFAEGMVALLIVLLVSNSMVAGVQFAIREYHRSMILSESRVLRSTLTDIITDELSNTSFVDTESVPGHVQYFSRNYAQKDDWVSFWSVGGGEENAMTPVAYGQIAVGFQNEDGTITGRRVLSNAAYSLYQLTAKVDVTCQTDQNLFHVVLTIRTPSGEDMDTAFDILCLNELNQDAP